MATPKDTMTDHLTKFTAIGEGVKFLVEGGFLFLAMPTDKALAKASKSGKMKLIGNTGGFTNVADGIRANVSVGYNAS